MPLRRKLQTLRRLSTALNVKFVKLRECFKDFGKGERRKLKRTWKIDDGDEESSLSVTPQHQASSQLHEQSRLAISEPELAPETQAPVFTLFNFLPIELRLVIWELSLPGPRIVLLTQKAITTTPFIRSGQVSSNWPTNSVEASCDPLEERITTQSPNSTSTLDHLDKQELDYPWRTNLFNLSSFQSTAKPPTLLYVCHESYEVNLKHYTKAFGSHCALPCTWFDYKNDTLLLTMTADTGFYLYNEFKGNFLEDSLPRIFSKERSLVRNIIVDFRLADEGDYVADMWLGWIIVLFPNVKSFIYELPTTKNMVLWDERSVIAEDRKIEFEAAFFDYRANGTVKYEIKRWKEYLEREHGCKDLVVKERCIQELLEPVDE